MLNSKYSFTLLPIALIKSPNHINNRYKIYQFLILSLLSLTITACEKPNEATNTKSIDSKDNVTQHNLQQNNALTELQGCYAINKDEPALIKVSQQDDKWVMQTNDITNKTYKWDTPEPLEVLTTVDSKRYFDIDPQYINATLARPDRILVLSHIKPEFIHLNMAMDSEFLAYIYKGSNTIYKVDCDTMVK